MFIEDVLFASYSCILLPCYQHRAYASNTSNSGDITLIALYMTIYYCVLLVVRIKSLTFNLHLFYQVITNQLHLRALITF